MTLAQDEFIPRSLIHVLPKGLHRIRHYGLFAKSSCADNIARARELLAISTSQDEPTVAAVDHSEPTCPSCGGPTLLIQGFYRRPTPPHPPPHPPPPIPPTPHSPPP